MAQLFFSVYVLCSQQDYELLKGKVAAFISTSMRASVLGSLEGYSKSFDEKNHTILHKYI